MMEVTLKIKSYSKETSAVAVFFINLQPSALLKWALLWTSKLMKIFRAFLKNI